MKLQNTLLLLAVIFLVAFSANAQNLKFPDMDKSLMDAAHYPRTSAYNNYMKEDQKKAPKVRVLYSRPKKNERAIFGDLVPYGKEWRLGANEAIEVEFFQPVVVGGKTINKGTYTLFADIYPDHWLIKVSSQRFIAGTKDRDKSKDLVHVSVPVKQVMNSREYYTVGFQRVDDESCNMVFAWDRVEVALPISFNPAYLASDADKSPMDLVQYPNNSRFQNFMKKEELKDAQAKVRVTYGRPQKNGRTIFGELVKYGEVWRLGANETTEITFFEDVMIGGKEVKKGRYGLFAKVEKGEWEFIIHKNLPSWGAANHDPETNVATVKGKVEKTKSTVEALSMLFDKKDDKNVHLVVAWDRTMVRMPIQFK